MTKGATCSPMTQAPPAPPAQTSIRAQQVILSTWSWAARTFWYGRMYENRRIIHVPTQANNNNHIYIYQILIEIQFCSICQPNIFNHIRSISAANSPVAAESARAALTSRALIQPPVLQALMAELQTKRSGRTRLRWIPLDLIDNMEPGGFDAMIFYDSRIPMRSATSGLNMP